jgi:hypothetical protein
MDGSAPVSILLIDDQGSEYQSFIQTVEEWAERRTIRLTRSRNFREAIELCFNPPDEPFDIVIGGTAFGESPFDLVDALETRQTGTIPVIMNFQANRLVHAHPQTRRVMGSPLSEASLLNVLDAFFQERQPLFATRVRSHVRADVFVASFTRGRTSQAAENTLLLTTSLSAERQLICLGELSGGIGRATVVRDYLLDRFRDVVPASRNAPPSTIIDAIVRTIHSDLAVLRYLSYPVDITMAVALIDTTTGTVEIATHGSERPILVSTDGEINPIEIDRNRTIPLQPETTLFFYTPRFFPPRVESDSVKQTFFRRLAQSSFNSSVTNPTDIATGTLVGVRVTRD